MLLPSFREHSAQLVRGVTTQELFLYWGGDEGGSDFAGPRHDPKGLDVGALVGLKERGGHLGDAQPGQALERIRDSIRANTAEVLERTANKGTTPRRAAVAMTEARVRRAMGWRRWRYAKATPRDDCHTR